MEKTKNIKNKNSDKSILQNEGFQALLASLICILLGMFIGYIVLLFINPRGAFGAILAVAKNFFAYSSASLKLKYLGNTLVKTAPLLMCSLSVLFAYKVGLFNIGVAGQYVVGTCACLYAALSLHWHWLPCMLLAMIAGALWGVISGLLKSYCNVNEVISGIMLNWIGLYLTNMILAGVKEEASPYTFSLKSKGQKALLPQMGLNKLFPGNTYIGIALILSIIIAVVIWVLLEKTKLGYELKATGYNKNAAKYAGMAEKRNVILTLAIGGALAGLAASFLFQTGFEQWSTSQSSVPAMGFNGIAAAFLGGLNPIGTIFAAYFIQHITNGGANVDLKIYCSQISDLISALIVYLCGFVGLMKYFLKKGLSKKGGTQ
ncbi:MAG: ABC transporter permease [Lachnospiraceae bacterium]|nr:ABC transporter permease [Lachnospiraceae bacterium]